MLIEWVSITRIRKKYNTCKISRVCNNRCLLLKGKRDHAWLCLTYFDFKFGDVFTGNRNFFDRDRRFYSKNWIFRIIEIRKIGNIFTLNNSKKDRDWKSDSKNPVVSKNRRSNHRGLTVFIFCFYHMRKEQDSSAIIIFIDRQWIYVNSWTKHTLTFTHTKTCLYWLLWQLNPSVHTQLKQSSNQITSVECTF